MENMQYELCQVKSKELLLEKKKASKQKNPNETAEVSAMNLYYWKCLGMLNIPVMP